MSSLFKYELIILDPSTHKYIESTEETDSFIKAAFNTLMNDKKLCTKILFFYCRKPKSGNLKYIWLNLMVALQGVPEESAIATSLN